MTTEKRIIGKALELFNDKGIEYVGMRELASALNMRVGNLTYYFPTKDDLVYRLSTDLTVENSALIVADEQITMASFLAMLEAIFRNHFRYRCLLLSFVHLMQRNPLMAERYGKTEKMRRDIWKQNVTHLQKNGWLALKTQDDHDFLVSSIALIGRFWVSEAAISYAHLSEQQQIRHYLELLARIFLPYASAKGKRQIRAFLQEK